MINTSTTVGSSYSIADLDGAIAQWQLDADYICCMAENLVGGTLKERCAVLFGKDGQNAVELITAVVYLAGGDEAAWDRAEDNMRDLSAG